MDLLLPLIPHLRFYQEIWIYLTPLIFMLADIITGFSGAYITKNIVSHKMRSGIIKKCGEMVVIFLTALVCFVLGLPHHTIYYLIQLFYLMRCNYLVVTAICNSISTNLSINYLAIRISHISH